MSLDLTVWSGLRLGRLVRPALPARQSSSATDAPSRGSGVVAKLSPFGVTGHGRRRTTAPPPNTETSAVAVDLSRCHGAAEVYRRHDGPRHGRAHVVAGQDQDDELCHGVFRRLSAKPESFGLNRGAIRSCLVAVTAALLLLSACGGGDDRSGAGEPKTSRTEATTGGASATPAVSISGFAFVPPALVVPAGTKVVWTNADDAAHSVQDMSELGTPVSAALKKGDTFSIAYDKPGTYAYVCGIHNYMKGSIEVTS